MVKQYRVLSQMKVDGEGGESTVVERGSILRCEQAFAEKFPWALEELRTEDEIEVKTVDLPGGGDVVEIPSVAKMKRMMRVTLNALAESIGIEPSDFSRKGDLITEINNAAE